MLGGLIWAIAVIGLVFCWLGAGFCWAAGWRLGALVGPLVAVCWWLAGQGQAELAGDGGLAGVVFLLGGVLAACFFSAGRQEMPRRKLAVPSGWLVCAVGALVLFSLNARWGRPECLALIILGVLAAVCVRPHATLSWGLIWRVLVGAACWGLGGFLCAYAAPALLVTGNLPVHCGALVLAALLGVPGLVLGVRAVLRGEYSTMVPNLCSAAAVILTLGLGVVGLLGGGQSLSGSFCWLSLPAGIAFTVAGAVPLLVRQKNTPWWGVVLLVLLAGYVSLLIFW